jgi:glycosyltransferase involved in cell wall biosynthesis
VLFVLPDFNGGGAEQAVLRLVGAWPRELPRPSVAVKSTSGALAEAFLASGVDVVDLGASSRHSTASSVRAMLRLRRILAERRPAAVVAVLSGPFVLAACRASSWSGRFFVSVQNPVLTEARVAGVGRLRRSIVGATLRRADGVLAISPGIAEELESLGVPAARITVVPNPVDLEAFGPTAASGQRPKRVVVLGRLEPQKRVDVALEAFAAAHLEGWELHVYGEGRLEGTLRRQAEELGITGSTRFHGFTGEPAAVLRAAGALLLSSEYEGFGNVIVEALAAGLPVVATDAPFGPRYILDGGRFGALCPVNDVAALADALRAMAMSQDSPSDIDARVKRAGDFASDRVAAAFARAVSAGG